MAFIPTRSFARGGLLAEDAKLSPRKATSKGLLNLIQADDSRSAP